MNDTELLKDTIEYYTEDPERRAVIFREDGFPICQYRTGDGRKCAIGRLITDEKYNPAFENSCLCMIGKPTTEQKMLKEAIPHGINLHLLDRLQMWHDAKESFMFLNYAIEAIQNCVGFCKSGPSVEIFIGTFEEEAQ